MNKQPFRLGTGGDWGFRGGDRSLGNVKTYGHIDLCANHAKPCW